MNKWIVDGRFKRYFWDHTENASGPFKLRRLIEYASFPDLIHIPFDFIKENIDKIDISRLRTSEKRIQFMQRIKKFVPDSTTWDEAIYKMTGIIDK